MNAPTAVSRLHVLNLFADLAAAPVLGMARIEALEAELDGLERRDDLALVLVRGGQRAFCLGADLAFIAEAPQPALQAYLERGRRLCDRIAAMPVPTIAAVGGMALGGGLELALACDIRWADRRAAFAFPESGAGLIPAWGGVQRSLACLPRGIALEMMLGHRIGSATALNFGLVSRLFEGRDFGDAVLAQAQMLAGQGSAVLRALKRSVLGVCAGQGDDAVRLSHALQTHRGASRP